MELCPAILVILCIATVQGGNAIITEISRIVYFSPHPSKCSQDLQNQIFY